MTFVFKKKPNKSSERRMSSGRKNQRIFTWIGRNEGERTFIRQDGCRLVGHWRRRDSCQTISEQIAFRNPKSRHVLDVEL